MPIYKLSISSPSATPLDTGFLTEDDLNAYCKKLNKERDSDTYYTVTNSLEAAVSIAFYLKTGKFLKDSNNNLLGIQ